MKQLFQNIKREKVFIIALGVMITACVVTIVVGAVNRFSTPTEPTIPLIASRDELSSKDSAEHVETASIGSTPAATASSSASATTAPATTKPSASTSATSPTQKTKRVFATAPKGTTTDYDAQWSTGYLIAIDAPDPNYATPQVNLSDDDRDLLERLCYGEFGNGGFVGAALIAQCCKDAMVWDDISSVAQLIKDFGYDGDTTIGTSEECREAVRYIFDENKNAVQHRLMYMYNPLLCESDFHESQNFILSYLDVRFFDRVGY